MFYMFYLNWFLFIDIKEFVLEHNRMQMPDDFYELLDFCKSINPQNPKSEHFYYSDLNIFKTQIISIENRRYGSH